MIVINQDTGGAVFIVRDDCVVRPNLVSIHGGGGVWWVLGTTKGFAKTYRTIVDLGTWEPRTHVKEKVLLGGKDMMIQKKGKGN